MCALEAEEGWASAPDGARLRYRVSGRGPFALVMPVNWGMDSFVYARGLSSLETHLALVFWDPRGVGESDPAKTPRDFELGKTADDACAVADAMGLPRSVVLGHSSGGAVALTYALAHPSRVSHLILLATAARWESGAAPLRSGSLSFTEAEMRERVGASFRAAVRDPHRFARAMEELLPRMRFSPERLAWVTATEGRSYDLRARLSDIALPTLVVHGRDDTQIPFRCAEEIHAGIPGSRLVALEGCGHWPHVERRAEFVRVVKEFLGLEDPVRRPS